jgi:tRNA pseudouridine55 synthase
VKGKRAYEAAREGKTLELKPREIEIKEFEINSLNFPEISFRVICSKGTYIRSLARDFGVAVDSGAYLSELRRTKIGDFSVENAESVENMVQKIKDSNEDLQ